MMELAAARASLNPCYCFTGMDARAVARVAGVTLGRLNVWSQRGMFSGLEAGVRGRRRDIDRQTATRIVVFAEMVRCGVAPEKARWVTQDLKPDEMQGGWLIIPGADPLRPQRRLGPAELTHAWLEIEPGKVELIAHHAKSVAELIESIESLSAPDAPAVSMVIDVAKLAERVRQAEAEWEASQRGQG